MTSGSKDQYRERKWPGGCDHRLLPTGPHPSIRVVNRRREINDSECQHPAKHTKRWNNLLGRPGDGFAAPVAHPVVDRHRQESRIGVWTRIRWSKPLTPFLQHSVFSAGVWMDAVPGRGHTMPPPSQVGLLYSTRHAPITFLPPLNLVESADHACVSAFSMPSTEALVGLLCSSGECRKLRPQRELHDGDHRTLGYP